jgi:hypothetical protein
MWENDSCREVIYVGDVQGPEKVNDIYVKMVQVGIVDRGSTAMITFSNTL